ncbi:MAG: hypothetical protein R6V56_09010 [Lentisphaeria bacterium]
MAFLLSFVIFLSLLTVLPFIPIIFGTAGIYWDTRSPEAVEKTIAGEREDEAVEREPERKLQRLTEKLPAIDEADKDEIRDIASRYLGVDSGDATKKVEKAGKFSFNSAVPLRVKRTVAPLADSGDSFDHSSVFCYEILWEDAAGNRKVSILKYGRPDPEMERLLRLLNMINDNSRLRTVYEIVAPMLMDKSE